MTTKKLLENLNKDNYLHRQYKVIAKTQHKDAKSVYVMQSDERGNPQFIIVYRLDINFLSEIYTMACGHLTARELKHFENAVKEDK